uniref:Uncharacterized protein n=1 Tax=Haplochromis burtoni TaxID=8153 RepID=A0A3Q2WMN1_HAPBU
MSFYLKMVLKQQSECDQTYPSRLLIWEDAALAACCEVAVNLEGVPGAALVWINPVLTWTDKGREKTHKNTPTHTHTDGREREHRIYNSISVFHLGQGKARHWVRRASVFTSSVHIKHILNCGCFSSKLALLINA